MGIDLGIPMAGKVLRRRQDTSLPSASYVRTAEPGHIRALETMNKVPLLALGMRLGEGTGAALAAGIVKAAAECHSGMATFEQAAVSNRV